jgi:hypothetical protein
MVFLQRKTKGARAGVFFFASRFELRRVAFLPRPTRGLTSYAFVRSKHASAVRSAFFVRLNTRCAPIFENAEREIAAVLKGKAAADREKRRAVFNSSFTSHQILGSDRVFRSTPRDRVFSLGIASRTSRGLKRGF